MNLALLGAFRAAGLGLALVVQVAWLVQPVPFAVKALPVSVALLSALRPAAGLIVLAGLGPMANAISLWSHSPLPGIRLLEQLVIAVVFGAGLGLGWVMMAGSGTRPAILEKSGGGGGFMTARGTANLLTRSTAILAGCFVATSLALAILSGTGSSSGSIFDNLPEQPAPVEQPAAPSAPAAPIAQ